MKKSNEACNDVHCPTHGTLSIRGRTFIGTVIKTGGFRTVTVEWPYQIYLSKYERVEKRRSRIKVHVPPCIPISKGDKVIIAECRPISKTKHFVVIKKK